VSEETQARAIGFTPRGLYRVLSIAEAITWTLLIIGLLAKYVVAPGENGDLVLRVTGTIHGFVFLSYGATAILVGINQRWKPLLTVGAVGTAVVPYATIPFDRWLEKHNDPRDDNWFDAVVRWMLRRPHLLGTLIVAAIVTLFVVLLIAGPPGGRE
jgi:integral membrane protein